MIKEKATLYRTNRLDNLLIFQARYQRFQFERHCHDEFALGVMEYGVQKFHCRGAEQCAPKGSLITVNPDEIHDGMSADSGEYRYRILYLPDSLLQQIGREMVAAGQTHCFRNPVVTDYKLAGKLSYLFNLLEDQRADILETQSTLYPLIANVLAHHGTEREQLPHYSQLPAPVIKACEYINDVASGHITLDDIANAAGLSRYHFLRLFTAAKDMSPYAFLLHRRLQLAKQHITAGGSLANAALSAGFSDQSHMSRRFKAAYGITPRQFQKAVR